MADGFIVRRGGVAADITAAPSINFVSSTFDSITFTITNNDALTADIFWEIGDSTPDANTLSLAGGATSSNQVASGLDEETSYTIFAFANAADKAGSQTVSITQTTPAEPFDPADLSPQLWLDAADATTITASSGSVSQWNNKGSLSNFAQATSAKQPTTGNSTLNGLNVIESDGDTLVATNQNEWKFMHDGTKYIFAAVFRREQDPTNVILSNISSLSDSGVLLSSRDVVGQVKSLDHSVFRGSGSAPFSSVNNTVQNVIDLNEWYIYTLIADPSNATAANRSEIFVDDGTGVKNNTETSAVSTANPSRTMTLFGFGGDSPSFKGKIAEVIVVSGANATETNRQDILNYLNSKWGVYA